MSRECFFCRKPLEVQHRATVFCSQRCQELYHQMAVGEKAPGTPARKPFPPVSAFPSSHSNPAGMANPTPRRQLK